MFERFSDGARQAVVYAQEEARNLGHPGIDTGHMLLGVVRTGDSAATVVLSQTGEDLERLREHVRAVVGPAGPRIGGGQIPFTPDAKRTLEASLQTAISVGHTAIQPLHILSGLISSPKFGSVEVLELAGADVASARRAVDEEIRVLRTPAKGVPLQQQVASGFAAHSRSPEQCILPAVLALELILGRSDTVAVLLPELRVYRTRVEWHLMFAARGSELIGRFPLPWAIDRPHAPHQQPEPPTPPCEISIRYPDGRFVDVTMASASPPDEEHLGMSFVNASGGPGRFSCSFFLEPLPGPGEVAVGCGWPAHGLAATETRIDTAPIIAASQRAVELWPEVEGAR